MTEQETNTHAMKYEVFIRKAFNCDRGKHGAEKGYLQFLLMADLGKNQLVKPYEKQFSEVKNYLLRAIDQFRKNKLTPEQLKALEDLAISINTANTATDIIESLSEAITCTNNY
jgi:hypothetical protein